MESITNTSQSGAHQIPYDGQGLKMLAAAGLAWLEHNYEHVNALNVFPVPDGDTGTNMLLTMRSAYKEIAVLDETHLGEMAQRLYNGALMGARGNSGVILSQLWRGFARGVEDVAEMTPEAVVKGFQEATRTADKAVQEPVEGTILTVARDVAAEAKQAAEDGKGLRDILARVVARAHWSVERTPQLLAVLKDAGVVDSGGMGLAYILEGMLRYIDGEPVELSEGDLKTGEMGEQTHIDLSGLEWPYDVQFLLIGDNLPVDDISQTIENMGDSALIVGDAKLLKVHVHVVNPGDPLGYAAQHGQLDDIVVENMRLQYENFTAARGSKSPDQPAVQKPAITPGDIAVITVAPGEGLTDIFYSLGAGHVIAGGQTMNPSTEDFLKAMEDLPTDKFIILPNNKNIFMAAEAAAEMISGKEAVVVLTRSIPQGISALLAFEPQGDMNNICEAMKESSQYVETGEVTTSTRDVTLDGVDVKENQIIGLHNDRLKIAGDDVNDVVLDLLEAMDTDDLELITLYYGAGIKLAQTEGLITLIEERYPDHEIELREGGQPHYFYIISVE